MCIIIILPSLVLTTGMYRKPPIISPGPIFAQRINFLGLLSGGLIFGGAYIRREIFVKKIDGAVIGWHFVSQINEP